MRIEGPLPSYYAMQTSVPVRQSVFSDAERVGGLSGPGVIVDISPEAQAAYARDKVQAEAGAVKKLGQISGECQTCKNRKYVDRSDDPSVSFQSPGHIDPGQAASVVMSHEQEHVSNEQARADKEGRRVVSQTVTLSMSACPECGRMYVSGGTTRTTTVKDNEASS
jgi:hypothetical protein